MYRGLYQEINLSVGRVVVLVVWYETRFSNARPVAPPLPREAGATQFLLKTFTERQGHIWALTVHCVPHSLDSGQPI